MSGSPYAMPEASRDPWLPLAVAAAVAMLLHLAAAAMLVIDAPRPGRAPEARAIVVPVPPPDPPRVGQDTSRVSSVAWIAHDDFRELQARQSPVEQPALQQTADPVAEAPPELDPTPPAPVAPAADAALAQAPMELPEPLPTPPALAAQLPLSLPDLPAPAAMIFPRAEASPEPVERQDESATAAPAADAPPAEAPGAAAQASEARPTASPRVDRESPPASREPDALEVRPGRVVAAEGIEIRTATPRFSIPARYTTPVNPEAELTFNAAGEVVEAVLVRSSGFENVDAPVLASLYRWRASGERFAQMTGTLQLRVTILLRAD